jgi:hypothetical protein
MTTLLAIILLMAAVAAVPVSRRLTGDYYSPEALVVTTWCATLGAFLLYLLPYPWLRPSTILFVLCVVVLMCGGSWVGRQVVLRRVMSRRDVLIPDRSDWWVSGFALLGLLGIAWYAWIVHTHLGLATFKTPHVIRLALVTYEIPNTFLTLSFFSLAAPLLAWAVTLCGVRLRWTTWALVAACAVSTWFTTDRTQFFTLTLTAFFVYVFRHGRSLTLPHMFVATGIVAALLVANFLVVGWWVGKTPENLNVRMELPASSEGPSTPEPAVSGEIPGAVPVRPAPEPDEPSRSSPYRRVLERAMQPGSTLYLYATGSYAALQTQLDEPFPRTHGIHVFYPIVRFFEHAGLLDQPLPLAIAPQRPLGMRYGSEVQFNAYTFLFYPLSDFGPVGAVVYVLAIGLLAGAVHGFVISRRESPLALVLMGQISMALVLSVAFNKFNSTSSWYICTFVALPFIVVAIRRRVGRVEAAV